MSAAFDSHDPFPMHPAAELFPLLDDDQLQPLCSSLLQNGYDRLKPILKWRGMILDGRNRLRACAMTGVRPFFASLPDHADPYIEAWKHNGLRRDLTPGQRAAIQAKITAMSAEWQTEQAERLRKANEARSATQRSQEPTRRSSNEDPRPAKPDNRAVTALAERAGVSRPTMERALKLQRENPEKLEAVIRGEKAERKKPGPRIDHDGRESSVRELHAQGLTARAIAKQLNLHETTVSDTVVKLGLSKRAGSGRLWADIDHVASTLEGAALRIEQLTTQLDTGDQLTADEKEIKRCIKSLSESGQTVRKLRNALKQRLR